MTTPAQMTQTKLFFGFNNAEGTARAVSDEAWEGFVLKAVAPRFLGFTIYKTQGYWRGVAEESRVVEILWSTGSTLDNEGVEAVRQAYCAAFNQSCVLRVDASVGVSF